MRIRTTAMSEMAMREASAASSNPDYNGVAFDASLLVVKALP
jgi:hypothetical protein